MSRLAGSMQEALADPAARSAPGVRLLLVVRPAETKLYDYLNRSLAGVSSVEVIMERRRDARRRAPQQVAVERRREERRQRRGEILALGYSVVRFGTAGVAREQMIQ